MSFRECIIASSESGRLSEAKRDEALAAFDKSKDSLIRAGESEDTAEYAAAHEALKAVTSLKSDARKARIMQMRRELNLHERIAASNNPGATAQEIAQEAVDIYRATQGQLARIIDKILLKYSPKKAGIVTPIDNMDNIPRSLYGEKTNPEADSFGKAAKEYLDFDRKLLNNEGASIAENENYRLWQSQDRIRVREAGEEAWVQYHLGQVNGEDVLDWDVMRYRGAPIRPEDREAILRQTWHSIVSSGRNKGKAAFGNNESLVSRVSRERFLYYKTANSWLETQSRYGTGNFFHQLVEHMDSTARNVSLMRTYGPNPNTGKAFIERSVNKRSYELESAAKTEKEKQAIETRTKNQLTQFDEMYRIHAREVDSGAGDAVAMTAATARTFSSTSMLGSAIVANLADPIFSMFSRNLEGLSGASVIPRYFDAIAHYKDFRQQVINNGIIYETLINRAYEGTRYNLAMEGSHTAKLISDVSYRLQGLSAWTNIGRGVAGLELAQALARVSHMEFDELPFIATLRTLGITKEDWNLVRNTPHQEPEYYSFGKGKFLRPIDMYQQANSDEMRLAAEKFLMFQESFVRNAIPNPDLRTRQALGEVLPAGQLYTQFFKSMTQLMMFPASVHFQYWKRIWQTPNIKDKVKLTGKFLLYSTLAGAMVTQTKDVLNGKKLHPMNTKEFWARAMLNGGAGGVIGDFLYDGLLAGSGYSAQTPTGQQFANLKRLTYDNAVDYYNGKGLHLGADTARFALGLFPKPPGIKLIVERMIMDPILEESDPAAYARKLQAQAQWEAEQGQGTWWGVGE